MVARIEQARDDGLLTPHAAQELTQSALAGLIGEDRQKAGAPQKDAPVEKVADAAAKATSAEVKVSTPGETVEASFDDTGTRAGAGAVRTSTVAEALTLVTAFAGRSLEGPWNGVDRAKVAKRLTDLVNAPSLISQAGLNLCGPAAFVRVWAQRDPAAFVRFATELYESGHSSIGESEVRSDDDSLLGQDYGALKAAHGDALPPEADWMVLGPLRDAENFFFDYEGTPEEDVSGITTPGEVVDWLRAAGSHRQVRDETNLFFTKGLAHADALAPATSDILLLINTALIPPDTTPLLLASPPTTTSRWSCLSGACRAGKCSSPTGRGRTSTRSPSRRTRSRTTTTARSSPSAERSGEQT